jgi:hypothetical protein
MKARRWTGAVKERPRPVIPLEEACVPCLTFARPWPILSI